VLFGALAPVGLESTLGHEKSFAPAEINEMKANEKYK
jgi:hypothetical protein